MRRVGLLGGIVLGLLCGCGNGDSKGDAASWESMKAFAEGQRAQAEAFFQRTMSSLEPSFAAAKRKAELEGAGAAADLEARWKDVSKRLEDMRTAAPGMWERARDAFVQAYEALKREVARR